MTGRLPGLAVALGRVLVTVTLLWLVLSAVGADAIVQALARPNKLALALALCVLLIQFIVMAWRWQVLLRVLFGKRVGLRPLALSIGQGMLASQALPATVGGDAYRVALVAGQIGTGIAVRSVLCDRLLSLAILVALVAVLVPAMVWRLGATPAVLSVAAASLAVLAGFCAAIYFGRRIARLPLVGPPLAAVAQDARRGLTERGARLASGLGIATHLLGILLVYLLALAANTPIPLLDCLLIVPPALLVSALPVSLGGWGVREGAFLAGFAMVGGDPAGGVTVSVLFGGTGILLGAVCALLAQFYGDGARQPRPERTKLR